MSGLSMHILLLDSRPEAAGMMQTLISHMKHRVTLAADVPEAFAQLGKQPFDCIICDLPVSESEACEFVKNVGHTYGIPCIVHSTPASEKDRESAIEAGYFDFVPKPVDFLQLKETLDRIEAARRP